MVMRKAHRLAKGDAEYHVTDGQLLVGTVKLVSGKYQALSPDGTLFGVFDRLWSAVAALPEQPNEEAGARHRPGHDAETPTSQSSRRT
jgi:hypothetical protein